MKGKKPWLSKTMWVNLIAIAGLFFQWIFGCNLDPQVQMAVLSLVNVGLRFITQEPLSWSDANADGDKGQ